MSRKPQRRKLGFPVRPAGPRSQRLWRRDHNQHAAASPANQVNFTWLRAFDLNLGWRYTKERFTIEPTVYFYNLFNFANFGLPPNTMSGLLTGSPGALNGTGKSDNEAFRIGNGTGVYALGSARQIEWGLKFTF